MRKISFSRSSNLLLKAIDNQWPEFKDKQGIQLMQYLASKQVSRTEKTSRLNAVLKICLDTWEKPN